MTEIYIEIEQAIFDAAVQQGVLVCKGSWFRANPVDEETPNANPRDHSITPERKIEATQHQDDENDHDKKNENKKQGSSTHKVVDDAAAASGGGSGKDMFFRTTFAAAQEGAMDEGIKRFGAALRAEFHIS